MSSPPDPASTLDSTLYEIVLALRAPANPETAPNTLSGCAICRLTTRSAGRWLRAFVSEYVNDPAVRDTLRRSRGFCAAHTRQLESLGDPLAVAILYSDLARLTRERWEQTAGGTGRQAGKSGLLGRLRGKTAIAPDAPCPACVAQAEAQSRYVGALAAGLDKAEVKAALDADAGLCAPHIEEICAHSAPDAAHHLRLREIERLSALQSELEEIVHKNDHRFRGEAWGPEKDAWRRALDKLKRDAQP